MQYIQFVVPIENALTTDPVQAMFCGPIAHMQRVLQVLESCGLPITVLRTEYPGRDLSIVDVLNAGCSKGHALDRWAKHRQITREQVMAIGDNYNDIEMLAFAGHPFIMGNASEELRARGWKLTRSNAESGVSAAVEHVLDGKEIETVVVDQIIDRQSASACESAVDRTRMISKLVSGHRFSDPKFRITPLRRLRIPRLESRRALLRRRSGPARSSRNCR